MTELHNLIAAMSAEFRYTWYKSYKFTVEIESECGSLVVDEVKFRRILSNLLANTFQYTGVGGKVSLHVARVNSFIEMEICDQGIGVPEEDRVRVLGPFFRGSNVGMKRGIGLGLDIVSHDLQTLKEDIEFSSKIGIGITVRIKIPWK